MQLREGSADVNWALIFRDPSAVEASPGWFLRNLLLLFEVQFKVNKLKVGWTA